ncbi:hypothetical protein HanHA300_Chr14g0546851 [Helianthus annuus]|nr:hypothetical protein HanHA300_Chr14g0546851 [Helianthus annuus]KAJ0487792.1 hypothetical protein HanHA89_Chr14g0594301 [Helianthus annuus]KAJ0658258.1 hypothetical protein HanLR1_Chr14g0555741 [Helianthus annuus]
MEFKLYIYRRWGELKLLRRKGYSRVSTLARPTITRHIKKCSKYPLTSKW